MNTLCDVKGATMKKCWRCERFQADKKGRLICGSEEFANHTKEDGWTTQDCPDYKDDTQWQLQHAVSS